MASASLRKDITSVIEPLEALLRLVNSHDTHLARNDERLQVLQASLGSHSGTSVTPRQVEALAKRVKQMHATLASVDQRLHKDRLKAKAAADNASARLGHLQDRVASLAAGTKFDVKAIVDILMPLLKELVGAEVNSRMSSQATRLRNEVAKENQLAKEDRQALRRQLGKLEKEVQTACSRVTRASSAGAIGQAQAKYEASGAIHDFSGQCRRLSSALQKLEVVQDERRVALEGTQQGACMPSQDWFAKSIQPTVRQTVPELAPQAGSFAWEAAATPAFSALRVSAPRFEPKSGIVTPTFSTASWVAAQGKAVDQGRLSTSSIGQIPAFHSPLLSNATGEGSTSKQEGLVVGRQTSSFTPAYSLSRIDSQRDELARVRKLLDDLHVSMST